MVRQDLFTLIHKGIRSLIYKLGGMMQSADVAQPGQLPDLTARVEHDLELLAHHGKDEDRFVFAELVKHEPMLVGVATQQHAEIDRKIHALREELCRLPEIDEPDMRFEFWSSFNRQLNDLLAFYLAHLCYEEEELLPATWTYFSDEEIIAIRSAIQKSMPKERYAEFLRLMLPASNDSELVAVLKGMKAGAPPPVLEATLQLAAEVLPPARLDTIRARAEL